uniref:ATP synthase subunit a n=1 Tax=Gnathostoma spinigerum TaxID=75299 RepID=A0A0K0NPN8_9BILA|nr:ATP synthase F0 subunit 6 [Gnathostoma spinigerum]AKM22105.1 ATP synthase F0 subunit 6 [Gnathostoma spinigerum]
MKMLVGKFLDSLDLVFSFEKKMPMSSSISVVTFLLLLVCCFGGYFTYSFCPCGMLEFTLIYAVVAWFSTLLSYISSEKFSIYMSKEGDYFIKSFAMWLWTMPIRKEGDYFIKSFAMLAVEIMSEFSRPLALTVRLTVNIMVGHLISMMLYYFLELFEESYVWLSVMAIMMECFVFFIQSYIFSRLIYLYLNE